MTDFLVCLPLDCEQLYDKTCPNSSEQVLCYLTESLALCLALGKYLLNA